MAQHAPQNSSETEAHADRRPEAEDGIAAKKPKLWMVRSGAFDCPEVEDLGQGRSLSGKRYFSNGNRGVIFRAFFLEGGTKVPVAVKEVLHERMLKPGRVFLGSASLKCEADWLSRLNAHGIGPKLVHADTSRVIMQFISGKRLLSHIREEEDAASCVETIEKVMLQLRQLDTLRIHKGELVKPDRHILVKPGGEPVLIDFERCKDSESPQNVTQFCQFLGSKQLAGALSERGVKLDLDLLVLREFCKAYKANGYLDQDFHALLFFFRESVTTVTRGTATAAAQPTP